MADSKESSCFSPRVPAPAYMTRVFAVSSLVVNIENIENNIPALEYTVHMHSIPAPEYTATNARVVYSESGTRGEKPLSLLSAKNKR